MNPTTLASSSVPSSKAKSTRIPRSPGIYQISNRIPRRSPKKPPTPSPFKSLSLVEKYHGTNPIPSRSAPTPTPPSTKTIVPKKESTLKPPIKPQKPLFKVTAVRTSNSTSTSSSTSISSLSKTPKKLVLPPAKTSPKATSTPAKENVVRKATVKPASVAKRQKHRPAKISLSGPMIRRGPQPIVDLSTPTRETPSTNSKKGTKVHVDVKEPITARLETLFIEEKPSAELVETSAPPTESTSAETIIVVTEPSPIRTSTTIIQPIPETNSRTSEISPSSSLPNDTTNTSTPTLSYAQRRALFAGEPKALTDSPVPPRGNTRKIYVPPLEEGQVGSKNAQIRMELEKLRASKKVQGGFNGRD